MAYSVNMTGGRHPGAPATPATSEKKGTALPQESIGVVTVSRGRPRTLLRAMASVFAQDYPGEIEHVVVSDEDPATVAAAQSAPTRPGLRVSAHLVPRPASERDERPGDLRRVYPRLSRLFNAGARLSSAQWIAFLDDDNEFAPEHLSTLAACAEATGSPAVHSGRTMHRPDGSPYLDELWHTVGDKAEAARIYQLMCARGVRVFGTNILLDRADPVRPAGFRTSSVIRPEDPVTLVDQSVWLIRRSLLLQFPIPETFTEQEHRDNTAPDDKLLETLLEAGIPIRGTGRPTVRYYLGGQSNNYVAA